MKPSQRQIFYSEQKKISDINNHFLELAQSGDLTREELEKLIQKRPALWGRFSNWLPHLPTKEVPRETPDFSCVTDDAGNHGPG
jgi:hypothetical protein